MIIKADEIKAISFNGVDFVISKYDFETLRRYRSKRIVSKQFYNAGPNAIIDKYAVAGIELEEGGAVTGAELSVFNGPLSESHNMLESMFGKEWYRIDCI